MPTKQLAAVRPDPIIEYYKQFVDHEAIRANLKLTPDERMRRFQEMAAAVEDKRCEPPSPERPWTPVSDTGPDRTTDPIIELYKQDVDRTLLRENLRRTPDHRCQALIAMARYVEESRSDTRNVGQER